MSRLAPRSREDLDDAGRAVWDTFVERRGDRIIGADGGLIGPFNAMVTAPHIGVGLQALGAALLQIPLDPKLREIAIITTGARWQAEFEWHAHAAMARERGVAEEVIEAIGNGEEPPFTNDDERVVHEVAAQLASSGRIDDPTYAAGQAMLGDVGMIELVTLCGFYAWVSYLLNAFDVSPPPGIEPKWPR